MDDDGKIESLFNKQMMQICCYSLAYRYMKFCLLKLLPSSDKNFKYKIKLFLFAAVSFLFIESKIFSA